MLGNDKRTVQMKFRVTEGEARLIRTKMSEVGIRSPGAYLRKMALDGYCIKLEIKELKEVRFLLRNAANNLNQYAKQANTTGAIYKKDIDDLKKRLDEIWEIMKEILSQLSKIQ